MKRLWLASSLLLLLLSVSLLNGTISKNLADDLTEQLTQAQQLAHEDQWDSARALTHLAYSRWQDNHFYLHITMRHSDTDEILRTFRSVQEYLELEETDQYVAANADLIAQITLLAEMEQATLANVF